MNIVIKFGFFAIIAGIANTKAEVADEIPLHINAISTTESQDGASTGIAVGAGIPALRGTFHSFIEDQDKFGKCIKLDKTCSLKEGDKCCFPFFCKGGTCDFFCEPSTVEAVWIGSISILLAGIYF